MQQPHAGRLRARAQRMRVGAQVGEARGVGFDGHQREAGACGMQARECVALAGAGDDGDVAVVEHRAQRAGEALEQPVVALQRRQRVRGRQAQAQRAVHQQHVVGRARGRGHGGRARDVGGMRVGALAQQALQAVGHRRPGELLLLHAAARDQLAAHVGTLHVLEQLDQLGLLVAAEVEVQHGVAAHLGHRRGARRDHRALARHRLEHGQAEALVARRVDERLRAGVGAAQVEVVQQHHVHVGRAGVGAALRIELAAAGAHDRVVLAVVAEQGEGAEEQRGVLVAVARARGHEIRARDAVALLEVGHLRRRGRLEVAAGVVDLHLHRAAGEALQVARGAFRDRGEALGVGERQRLLLPHRLRQVRAQHLGNHVVDHHHRRRGQRVGVVRGDEQRGADGVAGRLHDAAVALEVGVVQRRRVVVADPRDARHGARAVDHHQAVAERRAGPHAQQRRPDPRDARAGQLEEDAVDDDGRVRGGRGFGRGHEGRQAALRTALLSTATPAGARPSNCTDSVALRHMLPITASMSERARQPRRSCAREGSAAP